MSSATEVNLELCRALGIQDVHSIAMVHITLVPGKFPQLLVTRHLSRHDGAAVADRLTTVVDRLQLQPTPAP